MNFQYINKNETFKIIVCVPLMLPEWDRYFKENKPWRRRRRYLSCLSSSSSIRIVFVKYMPSFSEMTNSLSSDQNMSIRMKVLHKIDSNFHIFVIITPIMLQKIAKAPTCIFFGRGCNFLFIKDSNFSGWFCADSQNGSVFNDLISV